MEGEDVGGACASEGRALRGGGESNAVSCPSPAPCDPPFGPPPASPASGAGGGGARWGAASRTFGDCWAVPSAAAAWIGLTARCACPWGGGGGRPGC